MDDQLQTVQYAGPDGGTVTVQVCRECQYEVRGQVPPPDPLYLPQSGWPVTDTPYPMMGDPPGFHVCGICRRAHRQWDEGEVIRLHELDVRACVSSGPLAFVPCDGMDLGIKPGCYKACGECVERWRPIIYARLVAHPEHRVGGMGDFSLPPQKLPAYNSFGGNWLM